MSTTDDRFEMEDEDVPQDQEATQEPEAVEEPEPEEDIEALRTKLAERDRQYRESSKEGRRLNSELMRAQEAARAQQATLEAILRERGGPGPQQPGFRDRLVEAGVPAEAIPVMEEWAGQIAKDHAAQTMDQMLTPFRKAVEDQQRIQEAFPDYDANKLQRFLHENPDVKALYDREVTETPFGATAMALYQMQLRGNEAAESDLTRQGLEVEAMKKAARATGRVTGSRREAPSTQSEQSEAQKLEQLDKVAQYAMQTRNYGEYVKQRLDMVPSMKRIKWSDADQ